MRKCIHLKFLIIISNLCLYVNIILGQSSVNYKQIQPTDTFTNIWSKRITNDSLSSGFIIIIKNEVKLHKHQSHSEHVFVLEGKGLMTLADSVFKIKKGDILFIPQNTPHRVKVISKKPLKIISIQSPYFDGKDRIMLE